ncbi:HD domain-containing phosphohydrolase [Propionivibrio sp.]|uniref:HD-GYP domain-containing protein n=1 Tax=Propionivibrio sp. TaxID=2212460 RepID=UPI002618FA42|nr:HD domain-containing phosphohydrolase [Propionivibrio sp.]
MSLEVTDYNLGNLSAPIVLIIDDEFTSRVILKKIVLGIQRDIIVESFADPVAAMEWLSVNLPDLVIVDYMMTKMSGLEVVQHIRKIDRLKDVPIVVVTANEDRDIRYKTLEQGATDFILKPIDPYECHSRCRNLLSLRRHQRIVIERAQSLEQAVDIATNKILIREHETLFRLAKAGEYRDTETGNHILRMAKYSGLIAEAMQLSKEQCEIIELAAQMHDIGKIGIPDHILLKPGKLSPDEFVIMQTHPVIGFQILKNSPSKFVSQGAEIALSHHEKFDGSGYPNGAKGDEIPLAARIVAVADVYDALTSTRPYKRAWLPEDALTNLMANKGTHFDPDCVDAFISQIHKITLIQNQLQDVPEPLSTQQAEK